MSPVFVSLTQPEIALLLMAVAAFQQDTQLGPEHHGNILTLKAESAKLAARLSMLLPTVVEPGKAGQ